MRGTHIYTYTTHIYTYTGVGAFSHIWFRTWQDISFIGFYSFSYTNFICLYTFKLSWCNNNLKFILPNPKLRTFLPYNAWLLMTKLSLGCKLMLLSSSTFPYDILSPPTQIYSNIEIFFFFLIKHGKKVKIDQLLTWGTWLQLQMRYL